MPNSHYLRSLLKCPSLCLEPFPPLFPRLSLIFPWDPQKGPPIHNPSILLCHPHHTFNSLSVCQLVHQYLPLPDCKLHAGKNRTGGFAPIFSEPGRHWAHRRHSVDSCSMNESMDEQMAPPLELRSALISDPMISFLWFLILPPIIDFLDCIPLLWNILLPPSTSPICYPATTQPHWAMVSIILQHHQSVTSFSGYPLHRAVS